MSLGMRRDGNCQTTGDRRRPLRRRRRRRSSDKDLTYAGSIWFWFFLN